MAIPTYVPGYPPDGSSLGQTKQTIRNNLDGTFLTLAVDHVNNNGEPGTQPAGYHTIIHQVPQTSVDTVDDYNQVFSGVPGTLIVNGVTTPAIPSDGNTQLYSLNSDGGLHQLTGANPSATGYAWAGGILFQWGRKALINASTQFIPVTFPVQYPHNILNVQLTLICKGGGTSSSQNTISVDQNAVSSTGFTYNYSTANAGSYTFFYWLAIGN